MSLHNNETHPHLIALANRMNVQYFSYYLANVLSPCFVTQDLLCVCTLLDLHYATPVTITLQPLHLLTCTHTSLSYTHAEAVSNHI